MSHRHGDTKFLESVSNLRRAIKRASGRSPSAEVVRDISACLQQGRLFFEAASEAPLQIRPLQIFYGMVGFSKAVVLARNVRSISTLVQAHGLSDVSPDNATIAGMRLRFQADGIFQQFNDAVAPLGSIRYFDNSMRQKAIKPFDAASGLSNSDCSLTDLLGRIPGLQRLYHRTFDAKPECWHLDITYRNSVSI